MRFERQPKPQWKPGAPRNDETYEFIEPGKNSTLIIYTSESPVVFDKKPDAYIMALGGTFSASVHSYKELRSLLRKKHLPKLKEAKKLMYDPSVTPGKIVRLFSWAGDKIEKMAYSARK